MPFEVLSRHLGEVVVFAAKAHEDNRGYFLESYREDQFRELGLPGIFVQDNHSYSKKGVVRGLHAQWDPPMGRLMKVTRGTAFLVSVDLRLGSPTLGQWVGIEASATNRKQVWAPASFARGFCALTDDVEVQYKCTEFYNAKAQAAIRWNDSTLAIDWPIREPIVAEKDRNAPTLREWLASPDAEHFRYADPALATRSRCEAGPTSAFDQLHSNPRAVIGSIREALLPDRYPAMRAAQTITSKATRRNK